MIDRRDGDLGKVVSVSGARAVARLNAVDVEFTLDKERLAIGRLVAVVAGTSWVIGVISHMSVPAHDRDSGGNVVAEIDLLGEIKDHGTPRAGFQRGVSCYPSIGDRLRLLDTDDISLIHHISGGETINVGRLLLDDTVPAFINFDELLSKHFAVLGATGVGKSSGVALLLRQVLEKKRQLRVFLFDPHNEYGSCFGDQANVISPATMKLPFWLFNFEEIVDVFFRGRPGMEEETEILAELIPLAKAKYASGSDRDIFLLKKPLSGGFTADTPVPYRISDLVGLINERMGRLENRSNWAKYHRLMTRIDTLGQDSRYQFMFDSLLVEDMMADVLGELFRTPMRDKPITVMQMAGLPAEVVDSVVSVLARMAFEFGLWSNAALPLLVVCEEAHRYVPADRRLGFGPTRKALSRIAKEGRKYGVFLGVVTQRPAELDATILSQCSTVFAMRMANERDQAIVKSAVPDAGSSLIDFLAALGTREAIAFGEGVALPTRLRFGDLPDAYLPRSQTSQMLEVSSDSETPGFMDAVIARWREASTTTTRGSFGIADPDPESEPAKLEPASPNPAVSRPEAAARPSEPQPSRPTFAPREPDPSPRPFGRLMTRG